MSLWFIFCFLLLSKCNLFLSTFALLPLLVVSSFIACVDARFTFTLLTPSCSYRQSLGRLDEACAVSCVVQITFPALNFPRSQTSPAPKLSIPLPPLRTAARLHIIRSLYLYPT